MRRFIMTALLASALGTGAALAAPLSTPYHTEPQPDLGGGFIEFLFGGRPMAPPDPYADARRAEAEPRYQRQVVAYEGAEKPGTVIIDTPRRFLYLVQDGGRAVRYGIGVGRPGFTWAGVKEVSAKREWPDWTPPEEMLKRKPDLPHHMAGGPENPLGARALYLGSSLYRIHGSNEPWTIGTAVSSGCIRMRNDDVIDLYERVHVGTKVVVI
jgi:lipoprotein-anchoring transpeptidase ErfK/SrfK